MSTLGPDFRHADRILKGQHDLIFFEKRSTPMVVAKGGKAEDNPKYTPTYGKQTSRRAATAEEEKTISSGSWLRVDSKGTKGGQEGYKKTRYRPALVAKAKQFPAGDFHGPSKGQKCSRWGCGKPATASRTVGGSELGACAGHKAEMTKG